MRPLISVKAWRRTQTVIIESRAAKPLAKLVQISDSPGMTRTYRGVRLEGGDGARGKVCTTTVLPMLIEASLTY
jgi:hypothetical protein